MRKSEVLTRDSFKVIQKLGEGAYGSVYLVQKKDKSSRKFAMKELSKDHILRYGKTKAVFRERDILEDVSDHPNIV